MTAHAGQIYEVLKPEMVFEFTRARGRATSLVVRNEQDQVQATATRTPDARRDRVALE